MKNNPRHYRHVEGTCPEVLDYLPGSLWSRGPDHCNRPVTEGSPRCKLHTTYALRREAKWAAMKARLDHYASGKRNY